MQLRLIVIAWFFLAAAAAAVAQAPMAGAGSLPTDHAGDESHGWVVSPATGAYEAAVLHLPPRRDRRADPGAGPTDGMVRQAAMLPRVPIALAAWGNRVVMVFAPEDVRPGRSQRHVLTTGVVRGTVGGQWLPETEGRRLPALPALPGDGRLAGFVGTRAGPAALLDEGRRAQPALRLLLLTGSAWEEVSLPSGLEDQLRPPLGDSARLGLVAHPEGLALSVAGETAAGPSGVWVGTMRPRTAPAIDWAWQPLRFATVDGAPAPHPDSALFFAAGQYSYAARSASGDGVELWTLMPAPRAGQDGAFALRLAHLPNVSAEWAVAPLDAGGRIAVVWAERVPSRAVRGPRAEDGESQPGTDAPRRNQEIRRHIAEVSVYTGTILYDGPVLIRGPVSAQELRLLAVAMVALMAVIVIFILRPEPKGPPLSLPAGYALAEPGRRITASIIDLLAAAFITAQLVDFSLWELLTLRAVLMPGGVGIAAILMLMGIGYIMTTLGEWLAGRSLGKFITGCEVVRPIIDRTAEGQIVPSVVPPGPWRAAIRNFIKWTVPPVAMAGLGTPERRHRGDLAADTVVVIRIEEPEPA